MEAAGPQAGPAPSELAGSELDAELRDAFSPTDRETWMDAVRGVLLKGRSEPVGDEEFAEEFARRLVSHTEDGVALQPLYDADDAAGIDTGVPGSAPYVRSAHAGPRPWEVRQRVWPSVTGSVGAAELENGATGLLVELPGDGDADRLSGALATALEGVHLDLAPVSLASPIGDTGIAGATALLDLWGSRQVASDERRGTLGVDPIGAWARSGGAVDLATVSDVADVVNRAALDAPAARVIVADGTVWHDAGATDGQELAWTIAGAAALVRSLTDAGVSLERALSTIEFRWSATADQFATITKLRAARRLWARVTELAGVEPMPMFQHADGSRAMLTRYDPWVNALRSTVACFSAVVGGADAVTIWPHDALLQPGGSPLGRRIARNTQSVLQMESHLARVVDPGGGSWYVERRTDDLARTAWAQIRDVEGAGGLVAAVEAGFVHAALDRTLTERRRAVATRRRPLTGLSEFPHIGEAPPPTDDTGHRDGAASADATPFPPLTLHRLAEDFEHQRGRADAHERAAGERPTVFLAALGSLAASTPRATFAKNLFEAGGIRTVLGAPGDFDASTTTLVCLCSSDAVYREQGAAAAAALRAAGAAKVFVAGRRLDLDGVDEEIGVGSDVLDVLARTLDDLGVPA